MTDSTPLRDRIARALAESEGVPDGPKTGHYAMADAVLAVVGPVEEERDEALREQERVRIALADTLRANHGLKTDQLIEWVGDLDKFCLEMLNSLSDLVAKAAGLPWPIDFQIQSMTEANGSEHKGKMRNPMGVR